MSTDGPRYATRAEARAAAAAAAARAADETDTAAAARATDETEAAAPAGKSDGQPGGAASAAPGNPPSHTDSPRRPQHVSAADLSPAEAAAALGGGGPVRTIQSERASQPVFEPETSIPTELRAPEPVAHAPERLRPLVEPAPDAVADTGADNADVPFAGSPTRPGDDGPENTRQDGAEAPAVPANGTGRDTPPTATGPHTRPHPDPETAAQAEPRRVLGSFGRALALSLGVLVLIGGVGAAISLTQGPRAGTVAIDTDAVAEASGQRLVFTANQPLAEITAEQVTVTPDAPFSVVSSGRSVAVQFTYPLDPDTEYSVDVADVQSAAGGASGTLAHEFRTGAPPIYLLQRREGQDAVFSSNLAGDTAVPVFEAEQIEDFRAGREGLVAVTTVDDFSQLTAVTSTGETTSLTLPGPGFVSGLQVADHDGLFGYTFTDSTVGTPGARESMLFLGSLDDPDAEPVEISVGEDPRVQQWAFVPQTSYVLVLTFGGQLYLVDASDLDADPVLLGVAGAIVGVEHGSGQAIIQRNEGPVALDLTSLDEEALPYPPELEPLGELGAIATTVGGGTLRQLTQLNPQGVPTVQTIVEVSADGQVDELLTLDDPGDGIMQLCASPSGRYAAVIIAPDLVDNPYDMYQRPLPQNVQTHIIDTNDASVVTRLQAADISWCDRAL